MTKFAHQASLSALFLTLLSGNAWAQDPAFLTTSGASIVNGNGENVLLRGVGLGGWMVQDGYMLQTASFASPQQEIKETLTELIGEEATAEFYDAWLHNHCREADIDSMKAWGFNSVRLHALQPLHLAH